MNDRFYLYVYLDQRKPGKWSYKNIVFEYQPFYVGKGTGRRDAMHLCVYMLNHKSYKSSTIKSIIKETGELPIHRRIFENISQPEATAMEIDFIKIFGRKDNGTGILCNHTDGGDGSHNLPLASRNRISAAHCKSVYQYSLNGAFLKKWKSLMDVEREMMINVSNISPAVARNGTSKGFIWSYKYLGLKINPRIVYQMPIKHKNIKQVSLDTGTVIRIYPNITSILMAFGLPYQDRTHILNCLNGKTKSAIGYYWTTLDNFDIPSKKNTRIVCQYSKNGDLLGEYKSLMDAERKTGTSFRKIWECCNKKCDSINNNTWTYKHE